MNHELLPLLLHTKDLKGVVCELLVDDPEQATLAKIPASCAGSTSSASSITFPAARPLASAIFASMTSPRLGTAPLPPLTVAEGEARTPARRIASEAPPPLEEKAHPLSQDRWLKGAFARRRCARPSIAVMLVAPVPAPGWHSTHVGDVIKAVGDLEHCSSHSLALERKGGKIAERENESLFCSKPHPEKNNAYTAKNHLIQDSYESNLVSFPSHYPAFRPRGSMLLLFTRSPPCKGSVQ